MIEIAFLGQVPAVSAWAVEVEGFPPSTIDSEDLMPLFEGFEVQEIVLVRNFRGTFNL